MKLKWIYLAAVCIVTMAACDDAGSQKNSTETASQEMNDTGSVNLIEGNNTNAEAIINDRDPASRDTTDPARSDSGRVKTNDTIR